MPRTNKKSGSLVVGLWHIVSMATWDEGDINEEGQAFIEFEQTGIGYFRFGFVQGCMDWRLTIRDGGPTVEWSWDGNDEMEPALGRGWAKLEDEKLHGIIFIHRGDEYEFVATRAKGLSERGKR